MNREKGVYGETKWRRELIIRNERRWSMAVPLKAGNCWGAMFRLSSIRRIDDETPIVLSRRGCVITIWCINLCSLHHFLQSLRNLIYTRVELTATFLLPARNYPRANLFHDYSPSRYGEQLEFFLFVVQIMINYGATSGDNFVLGQLSSKFN